MAFIGFLLALGIAALAVVIAGVTLWSGWRALDEEIRPNFKTSPPGPRSIVLTFIGVVLPLLMIAAFTLYLAVWVLRAGVAALSG